MGALDRRSPLGRKLYQSSEWRRLSLDLRRQHPVCQDCGWRRSKDADHVTPPTTVEEFWLGPFRALCRPCHSRKTARFDRPGGLRTACDVDGQALTPEEDWTA